MDQDRNSVNSNEYVLVPSNDTLPKQKPDNSTNNITTTNTNHNDIELKLNEALNENNIKSNDTQMNSTSSPLSSAIANKDGENVFVDKSPQQQQPVTHLSLSSISQNSVLFYGITYLGCASVNAPKSETEINRIMQTLNVHDNSKAANIEIIMCVPNTVDEHIQLFDALSECEIATYKMSQVLFVVRGARNTREDSCFAFTTCHGDSLDNLIFPCHVFRCQLNDAVSKILYSFWTVFKRQQMLIQKRKSVETPSSQHNSITDQHIEVSSTTSNTNTVKSSITQPLSNVASSLFNSLYGSSNSLNSINSANTNGTTTASTTVSSNVLSLTNGIHQPLSTQQLPFAEQAVKFVQGNPTNQFVFRTILEIKEETTTTTAASDTTTTGSNSSSITNLNNYISVPKDKEFFKLRKNVDKILYIQIQQLSNKPLEIQRCFGVLLCAGRNCHVSDMQLLETISMGKSNNDAKTYIISAYWNPREPSFQVLNEETQKNMRVFLTIAIDLVLDTVQEPVRFCIETKARVYSQNEKFWVYNRTKFNEDFYLQLKPLNELSLMYNNKESNNLNASTTTLTQIEYHLDSIHSQTELKRKINAAEQQQQKDEKIASKQSSDTAAAVNDNDDDDNDIVFSGMGTVSKDLDQDELTDWTELLKEWHKNYNEKPKNLTQLIRKNGIPETLRGEVWQLLAGCVGDEKHMHESYRLLLSKESSSEQVILRDINRTFPGHQFFQDENGQQALYKLSKAYSIYDQEIGYCQGLSFLIATLLLHMPEEQAFNLLVKIMYHYQIREIYRTNFESLHLRFYQLEMLIQEYLPDLHEHFVDLNIETHMYASQWFLTLYTAKFPLYMVYRIIDLFLNDGLIVLFTIGIALLKSSQRELLMLDFEGILKYFRVQMPKKYRNEANFKDLMHVWLQISAKFNEKKLKKLEKQYLIMKEVEQMKEDPLVRSEKECKRLTQTIRRLEQENDDLANEFIETRIQLSKQLDDMRDSNDTFKLELQKQRVDTQSKINEYDDTNKKLKDELETIKQLWRQQTEKYEYEIERQQTIINEYKQICNKLSTKIEINENLIKLFDLFSQKYKNQMNQYELTSKFCEQCVTNILPQINYLNDDFIKTINTVIETNRLMSHDEYNTQDILHTLQPLFKSTASTTPSTSTNSIKDGLDANTSSNLIDNDININDINLIKIKQLELELARVKLELVDSQCKNQEYKHKMKQQNQQIIQFEQQKQQLINNNNNNISASNVSINVNNNNNNTESSSSSSGGGSSGRNYLQYHLNRSNTAPIVVTPANAQPQSHNNWLSKTFTQFKEATNQVVQKVKTTSNNNNNNNNSNHDNS